MESGMAVTVISEGDDNQLGGWLVATGGDICKPRAPHKYREVIVYGLSLASCRGWRPLAQQERGLRHLGAN